MSDQCLSDVWERFGLVVRSRRLLIPNGFGEFVTRRRILDLFSYLSRSAYKNVIRCRRVSGVHYADIHRYKRGESVSFSGRFAQEVDPLVEHGDRICTMAKWTGTPIISGLTSLSSGGDPCCHVLGRHVLRPGPRPVWGSLGRHVAHKGPLESPYGHDGVSLAFYEGYSRALWGVPGAYLAERDDQLVAVLRLRLRQTMPPTRCHTGAISPYETAAGHVRPSRGFLQAYGYDLEMTFALGLRQGTLSAPPPSRQQSGPTLWRRPGSTASWVLIGPPA